MLVKLMVAPLLLLFISYAQKKFGSFISGIIPGLPITSGPISYFIAIEQGKLFAANSAVGALYGMSGIGLFCFVYMAVSYKCGLVKSLLTALSVWCLFSILTLFLPVNIFVACLFSISTLLALTFATTKLKVAIDAKPLNSKWELPIKIVLVTSFIMLVTFISEHIGSAWSGLLSTFPVILAVMGSIAYISDKKDSALKILNGGIIGSLGGCIFFAVIALLLKYDILIWQVYTVATISSVLFTLIFSHFINRKYVNPVAFSTAKTQL
ncbi:hypothetical protein PTRA_a0653 [Pseudoalteromonas translucida KMM 520]|uniref:Uncharacterized protein n=1 Tax=Pseudoalteromonas translucida KMM 520 TaxID=1315283 RepID=A0A0U2WWI0_9GAMM|nr:hypothetical protein [Pseudoalteromonas translucida]ALS31985.1 hypothetical protein PTRA_a0653 [Pseudoalteromonas translucida KMM 520]